MKKLVVFGDSFVAPWDSDRRNEVEEARLGWIFGLGKKLELPILNYGIAGSALGFSAVKFFEYITSSKYDPEDIILFALTSNKRLYCFSMPDPGMGVPSTWVDEKRYDKKWLAEHRHHLAWVAEDMFHDSINYEAIKIMTLLKVWASANPTNILLALPLFSDYNDNLWEANGVDLSYMWKSEDNFISLQDRMTLWKITEGEFATKDLFLECMTLGDFRPNHLSRRNSALLIDMVYDVVTTGNPEYYTPGKFAQGFITDCPFYYKDNQ